MKTFDDIETLWKKAQAATLPDADVIIKNASAQKKKVANKIFFQVLCFLPALASLIVVMCVIDFKFVSSYVGLILMMLCIIIFAAVRFRQSQFLKKADFSQSPGLLLQQFEKFHRHQKWVNVQGTILYSIVLNIAFVLYFYETLLVAHISMPWKVTLLIIYIAWMLIATLWIGKKCNQKEHARTADIIAKLKQLHEALHNG